MRDQIFLNQGAHTMEVHTQPRNALINRETKRYILNQPKTLATIIIIIMDVKFVNQIRASDVDRRIISSQIVQKWTLWINKFTRAPKILKLVCTDQQKYIRNNKTVHMKARHRRYKRLWNICLPVHKYLEEILETALNRPIGF